MLTAMDLVQQQVLGDLVNIWNTAAPGGYLFIGLYQNNHTPSDDDLIGAYTPANFPGYAPVRLPSWSAIAEDEPNMRWVTQHPAATFTQNAAAVQQTIYGYYVYDTTNRLWFAEILWPTPLVFQFQGDQVSVVPTFSTKAENPGPLG